MALKLMQVLLDRIRILEKTCKLLFPFNTPSFSINSSGDANQKAPEIDLTELNNTLNNHFNQIASEYNYIISEEDKKKLKLLLSSDDNIETINEKFNFLNKLQEKYISVNFSTQKMGQEENNLLVAQTVMDIMKDLVINHNDPQKYFETTEES